MNNQTTLMNITPDVVCLLTAGTVEPFPEHRSIQEVHAWLERNRSQMLWASAAMLEDLIEEAVSAKGALVASGSGSLN